MTDSNHTVLLIEDEVPIRRFVRAALVAEGYTVNDRETGAEGLRQAMQEPPEIVILDLGLPDMDGMTVLSRLREWFTGAIIILTARDQERQKVEALDAGADDYLTKPFSVPELLARLRVLIRRLARSVTAENSTRLSAGGISIDLESRIVEIRGQQVSLTPAEYRLLVVMLQHQDKVLTHRFLLREVWGTSQQVEPHNLRVLMASLRRKIEADSSRPRCLLTETGVGYRCRSGD